MQATSNGTADCTVSAAWDAHHEELRAYLLRRTRDAAAADDLLQETFLRLLQECRAGRLPRAMRAWLYRVAHNALVSDARRRTSAIRATERLAARPLDTPDPELEVVRRDEADRVRAAFGLLNPAGRQAIDMAAAGYASREIAVALGRSDLAGRALLHRSRARLRAAIAEPA
jgi:RNA polymerase sigma-70 factor (ECF subfamily)